MSNEIQFANTTSKLIAHNSRVKISSKAVSLYVGASVAGSMGLGLIFGFTANHFIKTQEAWWVYIILVLAILGVGLVLVVMFSNSLKGMFSLYEEAITEDRIEQYHEALSNHIPK